MKKYLILLASIVSFGVCAKDLNDTILDELTRLQNEINTLRAKFQKVQAIESRRNVNLGNSSLRANIDGKDNVAIGENALDANINGSNNVAIGSEALARNTSGWNNAAVGHASLYMNINGQHNTAMGLQSMYRNSAGSHNVGIGRDALFSNTIGNWNTALGVDALPGNETGNGNTSIGGESGYTEEMAHQNVTGSFNTWLGYRSGPASAKQVNNSIAIGYGAKNSSSDQVVVGNKKTKEVILNGTLKVNRLCLGNRCFSADNFGQIQ